MGRRYELGEFPVYDSAFEFGMKRSPILNEAVCNINEEMLATASLSGLRGLIQEREAAIARSDDLLERVGEHFEDSIERAKREGRAIPTELSPPLDEERLKCEARIDVLSLEIGKLKEMLASQESQEQTRLDGLLLKRGPVGSGKLLDGVLVLIDHQPVVANDEGILHINCEKSPYHGMTVESYRRLIVTPFKQAQAEKFQAWRELPPEKQRGTVNPLGMKVPWDQLPPRPEECEE